MDFSKPQKTDYPIEGVKCTVEQCYYNTNDGGCTASAIEVGGLGKSEKETDCKTFSKKESSNS